MDTYANIRPVKSYNGINCLKNGIDYIIVRENTEGLYKGIESEISEGVTIATRVITKEASERIFKYAFEMAKDRKKQGKEGKVTCRITSYNVCYTKLLRKLLDSINDTLDETKSTISEVKTTIEPIQGLINSFSKFEKPVMIGLILFGALLVLDLLAAFIVLVKIAIWG